MQWYPQRLALALRSLCQVPVQRTDVCVLVSNVEAEFVPQVVAESCTSMVEVVEVHKTSMVVVVVVVVGLHVHENEDRAADAAARAVVVLPMA